MNRPILAIALSSLLLMACRSEPETPVEPVAETAPPAQTTRTEREVRQREAPTQREARDTSTLPSLMDPARELPRLEGALQEDGWGLEHLIDGSSPQAFMESLELIANDTSARQFQSLDSALRYLQVYSLGHPDLASFYRSLDNLTANEVIERAHRRQAARHSR